MDNTEDDLDFSIRDGKDTKSVAMDEDGDDDGDAKYLTTKEKKTSEMIHQTLKNVTLSLEPPTPDQLNRAMDKAKEEYCKRATQWIPEKQKQFKANSRPSHHDSNAVLEDERRELGDPSLKTNRMTEPVFSRAADKRQQQQQKKKKRLLIDSDDEEMSSSSSQQQQSYKSTSSSSSNSSSSMSLI